MKRTHVWLVAGLCLIVSGAAIGVNPLINAWHSAHTPRAASPFVASPAPKPAAASFVPVQGKPVRILIPSLGIDLPVIDGVYNAKSQTWTLSNDKVQYAVMTPLANNVAGNTFLYGHNKRGVFNTLHQVQPNDEAIIMTDNGHRFSYRFAGSIETVPTDDSLFRYQGKPILTVQTCSGIWYQNRQLFTFNLESVV